MSIGDFLIVILVSVAVGFDVRTYKIPNPLNVAGCITGAMLCMIRNGLYGLRDSLIGIVLPFVALFVLFNLGIMGAGDIKLLSAIGSYTGLGIIWIAVYAFVISAIYGIVSIIYRLSKKCVIRELTKIHLSIPIAIGTLIYVCGGAIL